MCGAQIWSPVLRAQHSGPSTQSPALGAQHLGPSAPGPVLGARGPALRVECSGSGAQGLALGAQHSGPRTQGPALGAQCLGSGAPGRALQVQCSGLGVQHSGLRAQGLALGVQRLAPSTRGPTRSGPRTQGHMCPSSCMSAPGVGLARGTRVVADWQSHPPGRPEGPDLAHARPSVVRGIQGRRDLPVTWTRRAILRTVEKGSGPQPAPRSLTHPGSDARHCRRCSSAEPDGNK